jgi:hypothetical protein
MLLCPVPEDDVNDPEAAQVGSDTGFGLDVGCEFAESGAVR